MTGNRKLLRAFALGAGVFVLSHAVAWSRPIDPSTLTNKLIMGYQGWFACPGDTGATAWHHWFAGTQPTVDLLPDTTELPPAERCPTQFTTPAGQPITLFSSQRLATVERHFAWMQQYGLDGVALERFATALALPDRRAPLDRVLANVRQAAEDHSRVFFLMYDLSGMTQSNLPTIAEDWARLENSGLTNSPAYLHHRGHPLLGLWGLGFAHRPITPDSAQTLLDAIAKASAPHGGVTLLAGVPAGWRTGQGDADPDPDWQKLWPRMGVLSPWTVGRYANEAGADHYAAATLKPDMVEAARLKLDYMPVVFPGFSWANLTVATHAPRPATHNQIPRNCGRFYWRQITNALGAGANMIFGAMFDEVDEGTAMFKMVPTAAQAPTNQWFLTLDADGCKLPSDFYLRLAAAATEATHRGGPVVGKEEEGGGSAPRPRWGQVPRPHY